MKKNLIEIIGARENNLKNINVNLEKNKLIVITGPSGSGKSSLAFDTIFAEGQRRYISSFSHYAMQFLNVQDKPDVDSIKGLSPSIAIDQKTNSKNPRSTVGTITEIHDYLRTLFARIGIFYSPITNQPMQTQSAEDMVEKIYEFPMDTKLYICAPIIKDKKGDHLKEINNLVRQGFKRLKINNQIFEIEKMPTLDKNEKHTIEAVIDRIVLSEEMKTRLTEAIKKAIKLSGSVVHIDIAAFPESCKGEFKLSNEEIIKEKHTISMSQNFACPMSNFAVEQIEPKIFSFNSPFGACEKCNGLGTEMNFNINLIVPNPNLSLAEGAIDPWNRSNPRYYRQILQGVANHFNFDMHKPFKDLDESARNVIFNGCEEEIIFMLEENHHKTMFTRKFDGVLDDLSKRDDDTEYEEIASMLNKYKNLVPCRKCNGQRLKKSSLCIKINQKSIGDLCDMSIGDLLQWIIDLPKHLNENDKKISDLSLKEIIRRLEFLIDVGLEYLSLNRSSCTLSGGESQRIRLATQIGSELNGLIYVLDEPSIGLHQSDNIKLINTLKKLRDIGNTVIVVEHDEETMLAADYIVDIGPCAGEQGGYIVSEGDINHIKNDTKSVTGKYLSGEEKIYVPSARKKFGRNSNLKIVNARGHNLKNITVEIPLGMFVCVTGVSGGGKSTLIIDTLCQALQNKINGSNINPEIHDRIEGHEYLDKIIEIDQSPIGRTPRSNPATYIGAFNNIRDIFVNLTESKMRGYKSGHFSFNVKGGRCEKCQGDGVIKIEMNLLPDVYINCDSCHGQRYNSDILEVKYNDKSISDILKMTAHDACKFFNQTPIIKNKFKSMCDVGLGYMKIGQQATTLSGGEAQRIKLAKELCKKSTGNTLYILDEPTTGLHASDIKKLLNVLHSLVDYGNSMIVIEHNLDVIKTADHVIDIGPYGGTKGGEVVAQGTPEEVAKNNNSITGRYLKKLLKKII